MIVLDSSALAAIFHQEEPDWSTLLEALQAATQPRLSAANLVETLIVLGSRAPQGGRERFELLLHGSDIVVEPVTERRAFQAAKAYNRFGRGYHKTRLNYGDCFGYALATELDMPLLYKGNDFAQTDIRPAL